MRFGLLGNLKVDVDGVPVDVGGTQPRTVLAVLLVAGGRVVPAESIIEALWGEDPPDSALGTLQSYVSRLRRALVPDGAKGESAKVLAWEPPGYKLVVGASALDTRRFEALADQGRALLIAGDPEGARQLLGEALALWRGPAMLEFAHLDFAWGFAAKLEERRLGATEDRIDADLRLGRHGAVIGELGELVAAHPLREGLRAHLSLALYRSGRQAEALRVLDDARRTLRNQLGIDPGRPLRDLESAILTHDPGLELAPSGVGAADRGGEAGGVATAPENGTPGRAADEGEPVRAPEPPPVAPVTPPRLVGRDLELRQAIGSLDEARHATRIVVVEGEPGIGKTRLFEELAAEAATRGSPVLWGRAYEGGAAPALWPWLTPIRSLVAGLPTGAEANVARELRDLVACPGPDAPVPLSSDAGADGRIWADAPSRYRLFDAVTRLLSETVGDQPLVLVLDDLQWADIASLELLAWVSAQLVDTPLLLACTVRELEVGRNDAVVEALAALSRGLTTRRILLRGLSHLATGELVEQASGRAVEPQLVAAIQERADGNPFFATELAQLIVAERGRTDTAAVVYAGGDIPSGVRDVVRRRLALLPPTAVELLQVAAVIGRDVGLDLLTATAGIDVDVVIDGIEPALLHRLLAPIPDQPATFRFAHALLREAVADDVSPLRRARLHLRVADALAASPASRDDTAEILAEHLWDAVPVGVGTRAAEALERAAEVAVQRFAFGSAESLLERAVQLRATSSAGGSAGGSATGSAIGLTDGSSAPAIATDDAAQAELRAASRLLSIQRSLHGYASVVDSPHLARAEDLAVRTGRTDVLARLLWTEWGGYNAMCDFARAEPLAERLYELSEQGDDPLARLTGLGALGTTRWTQGRITEAADLLDRAVEAGKAVPRPAVSLGLDLEVVALPYPFSVYMHVLAGDLSPAEAEAAFEELADLAPDRYAVEVMEMVASAAAVAVGDGDWAERAARRGLAADPDVTFSFWGRGLECYQASAMIVQGLLDKGLELIGPAIERFVGARGRTGVALLLATQASGLARAGRIDEATAALAEAQREFDSTGEQFTEPLVIEAEAVVAHARGDASAASLFERAVAAATGQGAHGVARRVERTARELGVG